MRKIKLPISERFCAALILVMCLLTEGEGIIFSLFVLVLFENEWLKKMMVRTLIIVFLFYIVSIGVTLFTQITDLIRIAIPVPYNLNILVSNVVQIIKYLYITIMAAEALRGKIFTFGFVENYMNKVYQNNKGSMFENNYCVSCGNILEKEDLFCPKCGTKR